MPQNELQIALVGTGVFLVLALIGYNLWQERRARKHAEQVFRSTHRDVLLDEDVAEAAIPPAPGGRMEPGLPGSNPSGVRADGVGASGSIRAQEPVLPWEAQAIDCVVNIEAPAGLSASSLFLAQQSVLAATAKSMSWFGWDDAEHAWVMLDARTPGSLNRACVALQLVDRRGMLSESELQRFYDHIQSLCDQFLAVPRLPARAEVIARANEIDRFCSEVDVQIAINLAAQDTAFAGTKIRSVCESAGLALRTDGAYHAVDEAERSLFVLTNQEAVAFSNEQLRHLQTHGLTLTLDVPRVAGPTQAFDKMIAFAQHLADSLDAAMVDDNRVPLSERSIGLIRGQINQFEQHMERQAIPAGSAIALRLFS